MHKYCQICGIECADSEYDSPARFRAVKYCDKCRLTQYKKARAEADRRYKDGKKLEQCQKKWAGWKSVSLELEMIGEKERELRMMRKQNQLREEETDLLHESIAQLRAKK